VKVAVTEGKGLIRQVSVEIPSETVQGELDKKFAEVRQNADIKGFRKGKVPMARIKSMYGDAVKADVVEEIIRSTYPQAVKKEELRVAAHPTVTEADFTDDGGFAYVAEVEVFPVIEDVNTDGLEAKVAEVTIGDKEVDEFIGVMLKRSAEENPVDRPVADGDLVVLDLKKLEDPKGALDEDSFLDQQIDLDSGNTVHEFKDQLPGHKAGDEFEITINYPEDYSDKRFSGSAIKYAVSVKEVKERILPEFNDAFAKASGSAETALELRMTVRKELESRVEAERDRSVRGQLIDGLTARNEIPVPEALLENYLKNVFEDFKKRYDDVKEEDIKKNYRDVGLKTIRWNMLYQKLSEQEKIEVLPADTEKRIKKFADNYGMTVEQAKKALAESGNITDIRDSILEEKILDFLAGKADVKTVKGEQDKS
jgi:trigger factor